jgi:hypothetical protein
MLVLHVAMRLRTSLCPCHMWCMRKAGYAILLSGSDTSVLDTMVELSPISISILCCIMLVHWFGRSRAAGLELSDSAVVG